MKRLLASIASGFLYLLCASLTYASCLTMNGTISSLGNWPGASTVTVACRGDDIPGPSNCVGDSKTFVPSQGGTFSLNACSCLTQADGTSGRCLSVYNMPPNCHLENAGDASFCGINGDVINPQVKIVCDLPEQCITYCDTSSKCDATHYKTIKKCSTAGNPADSNVPGTFTEQACGTQADYHTNLTNTCQPIPTNTPTPPRPTNTPIPTPTRTPSPTPTRPPSPTATPAPSVCPVLPAVTNVKISCPSCGL